jgi:hypothetical protein
MAHKRNEDFYLYTGLNETAQESYQALTHLRSIDGFKFIHLHYGEPNQHPDAVGAVQTWFQGQDITLALPFVVYTQVNEPEDIIYKQAKVANGIDSIRNTDWLALYNFQG